MFTPSDVNDDLEKELRLLRDIHRAYYIHGKINQEGSADELQACLKDLGYDVPKSILVPAKALLQERHAPSLDNACRLSLLSPRKTVDYCDNDGGPRRTGRRPIDEPTFLELLGSLEKIGEPGKNTDIWRYIFKRTPLHFPGAARQGVGLRHVVLCQLTMLCGRRGEGPATVPQRRHLSGFVGPQHARHRFQLKPIQRDSLRTARSALPTSLRCSYATPPPHSARNPHSPANPHRLPTSH
jgi:hypothetical protein